MASLRDLRNALLLAVVFFSCSATIKPEIILVGSTPGDELVKSMLAIPAETKIDFIRWNLALSNSNFKLLIVYGESQPNTLGLKGSGTRQSFDGTFTVSQVNDFKEAYHLKSKSLRGLLSLVKVNENLFHLLTPQHQLMIGNGGWSYSLNRKVAVDSDKILISSPALDEKSLQLVFDGRTPCQEIAADHPEMKVSQPCFKLKWRLILNRDPVSYLPTTYSIRKVVDNEPSDVSGKWTIVKGTATNPEAIVYKIEPDRPEETISFLAASDDILFFLNKKDSPYIGNEDFSFTLNRKDQ